MVRDHVRRIAECLAGSAAVPGGETSHREVVVPVTSRRHVEFSTTCREGNGTPRRCQRCSIVRRSGARRSMHRSVAVCGADCPEQIAVYGSSLRGLLARLVGSSRGGLPQRAATKWPMQDPAPTTLRLPDEPGVLTVPSLSESIGSGQEQGSSAERCKKKLILNSWRLVVRSRTRQVTCSIAGYSSSSPPISSVQGGHGSTS
jgi:hypothetical protein